MKKRILFIALMVIAFVCAFAITAFAEDIIVSKTENDVYGTIIQLREDPGLDNARQYVSTLKKINDSGKDKDALCILTDGTYFYVFPASYIVWEMEDGKFEIYAGTSDKPGLAQAMDDFNTFMKTDYYDEYAMTGTYGDSRLANLVRFEFTSDVTYVHRDHCLLRYCSNLVEVRINHALNLKRSKNMFRDSKNLKTVVGFEKVTNLESDTSHFMGCSALESISLPADIVKIPDSMFWGCGKVTIDNLSELTQLNEIGATAFRDATTLVFTLPDTVTIIGNGAFQSAFKNGGALTINHTSNLEIIGDDAFSDCRTLSGIYIPSTVKSIGARAFQKNYALEKIENFENCLVTELGENVFDNASKISIIRLPKNLKTLGKAFNNNESLKTVYLPDTITSIEDTFTGTQPEKAIYIYTGENVNVLSTCTRIAGSFAVKYDYSNPSQDFSVLADEKDSCLIVYGYDKCKAFYDNVHNYVNEFGDCKHDVECSRCPAKIAGRSEHTFYETLVYPSFTLSGLYNYGCSNEGCTKYDIVDKVKAPIFEAKGYSYSEKGIAGGYAINIFEYNEYVKINKKEIHFGVLILNPKDLDGEKNFFDGAKVSIDDVNKFVMVEITEFVYSNVFYTINGFTKDSKNLELVICAYAYVEGEPVQFIQNQTTKCALNKVTKEDATLYTVTYNSIKNRAGNEIPKLDEFVVPKKKN